MWQDKQANFILPGQKSFPQGAHVGNTIIPPPSGDVDSDFVDGPSRKRKSIHLAPPRSTSEYFPLKSNLQDDSSLLGSNRQGNNQGVYSNQSKSVRPVNFMRHNDYQVHYQNEPALNSTSHSNGIKKIENASYNLSSQSLEPNGNMPIGDRYLPPFLQSHSSHVFSQTEVHRSLPLLNASNVSPQSSQGSFGFQESVNFGTKNYVMPENIPRDMASSDCRRPTESLQPSFVQPSIFSDMGKTCSQEECQFEISCEPKETRFCSKSGGANDLENVRGVLGASVCTMQEEKNRLLENEVRGAPSGKSFVGDSENKERSSAERILKVMDITAEPGLEKPKLAFAGNNSSKNRSSHDNTVGHGQENDLSFGYIKSDEKTRLHSEKPISNVVEKLWDGSLQLSSSVSLSAVAFFKSGEKLLDINWPEFIEVKGKVRLEAFEKYIQDLPRSRNRGLMVISICWKEGTSVTGLTGIKEVSKGYKKGAKVGFAQLSSGTDLYICPRSDTIVTILAKHGFFKGMSVIDDNQDSLIGCVVWKKNRPPSNPVVEKKVDSKISSSSSKQPQFSNAETELFSPIRQTQESSHSIQDMIENGSRNGTESKEIDSSLLPNPSVLSCKTTPVPVGQLTPNNSSSPLVISEPSPFNSVQKPVPPAEDDDDLPEYDFGVKCGNFAPPQIHVASMLEEKTNKNEVSSQELTKKKNIFDDDDDDMPEWCPPEHHSQSTAETIRPPISNNLPLRPPLPSIRPPIPTDTSSVFSYQPFNSPFSRPPSSIRPPQPLPLQSGPSSLLGLPRPPIRPEFQLSSDRRR